MSFILCGQRVKLHVFLSRVGAPVECGVEEGWKSSIVYTDPEESHFKQIWMKVYTLGSF